MSRPQAREFEISLYASQAVPLRRWDDRAKEPGRKTSSLDLLPQVPTRSDHSERTRVSPTVIVTGGSRGIGAATAKLAARTGYAVCLSYRQNSRRSRLYACATRMLLRLVQKSSLGRSLIFIVLPDDSYCTQIAKCFQCCNSTTEICTGSSLAGSTIFSSLKLSTWVLDMK